MEELRLLFDTSKLRAAQACERAGAGRRQWCSNPNELVEPDVVPPRRGPDCNGSQGPRERPLPVDVAKTGMLFIVYYTTIPNGLNSLLVDIETWSPRLDMKLICLMLYDT